MAAQMQENPDQAALARTLATIDRLSLNSHLNELETQGWTTIKGVLSQNTIERAINALLDRVEKNTGKRIDIETATEDDFGTMDYLPYMLYDDEVFEEVMMEEKPLAMISYLLGESCKLSSIGCHFKGMTEKGELPLHSDTSGPQPFSATSTVANVNYALTPYSKEAGALAMVPGSHKLARQPMPVEMMLAGEHGNSQAVSQDLQPGDCVVWHGNAWHGSYPRQIPGIRMNLAVFFARHHIVTQERHKDVVPAEVLQRHANDDRFKRLMAIDEAYGWSSPEGPDYAKMAQMPRGLYD